MTKIVIVKVSKNPPVSISEVKCKRILNYVNVARVEKCKCC